MPTLHICPLEEVPHVMRTHTPSHAISLVHLRDGRDLPSELQQAKWLHLNIDDIEQPQADCIYPEQAHIDTLVQFMQIWSGEQDILIHCWQGISRSVAAGLILLAMHAPGQEQGEAARLLQAMPFARPNRRLLGLADEILGSKGRITQMADCFQPDEWVDLGKHCQISIAMSRGFS